MFTGVHFGHLEPQDKSPKRGRPPGRKKKLPKRQLHGSLDDPLHRGRVIQYVADHPNESLREIGSATGANPATISRYRASLRDNPGLAGIRTTPDSSAESTPTRIRRTRIARLDRIVRKIPENQDVSTVALAQKIGVHRTTIRRYLRSLNWAFVDDRSTPNTSDALWRSKRLEFAQRYQGCDAAKFVFCDEKIFRATASKRGRWRHVGNDEAYNHNGRKRVVRDRWTCSMHVFGMVGVGWSRLWLLPHKGTGGRGGITATDFQKVLEKNKGEIVRRLAGKILVLDGASIHTSQSTQDFWRRWGVEVLRGWPPHSPDLNPIENLWSVLVRRIGDSLVPFGRARDENRAAMRVVLKEVHAKVEAALKTRLVLSFASRLDDVLLLDGDLVQ